MKKIVLNNKLIFLFTLVSVSLLIGGHYIFWYHPRWHKGVVEIVTDKEIFVLINYPHQNLRMLERFIDIERLLSVISTLSFNRDVVVVKYPTSAAAEWVAFYYEGSEKGIVLKFFPVIALILRAAGFLSDSEILSKGWQGFRWDYKIDNGPSIHGRNRTVKIKSFFPVIGIAKLGENSYLVDKRGKELVFVPIGKEIEERNIRKLCGFVELDGKVEVAIGNDGKVSVKINTEEQITDLRNMFANNDYFSIFVAPPLCKRFTFKKDSKATDWYLVLLEDVFLSLKGVDYFFLYKRGNLWYSRIGLRDEE